VDFMAKKKKKKKKTSKSAKKAKTEIPLDSALKSAKKPQIETPLDSTLKSAKQPQVENPLDIALKSSEETHTDLQGLLQGVSEGAGYYRRVEKVETEIVPQLVHEGKSEIAEMYAMEDVPLTERKPIKKRTPLIDTQKPEVEKVQQLPKPKIKQLPTTAQPPPPPPPVSEKENIYSKLEVFFEEYMRGYSERYTGWEESIGNILAILRKMRKVTKTNTETLVLSISNLFGKIQSNLDLFKIKRNEIEKIANVNLLTMSSEFKKVLGLLELQVKEYQLKKLTDDYVHEREILT